MTKGRLSAEDLETGACACFNLRKATRAITQLYDSVLRPVGLRTTQFTSLSMLHALGPLTISQLAEHLVVDRTTLTRNLEVLERDGLVRIVPGEDRRVRTVSITAAGEKARAEARMHWKKAQDRISERLGGERFERLLDDLAFVTATER